MRIDLICKRLYGTMSYIEELMIINDIIDPWSLNTGDVFYYIDNQYMESLHYVEENKEDLIKQLVNPAKSSSYPPTVKPAEIKTISVDKNTKKISIINNFK